MPSYSYTCSKCGHSQKHVLPMAEREIPETVACPGCLEVGYVKQDVSAPFIGDSIRQGITKAPSEFRNDVLKPAMNAYSHTSAGNALRNKYKL